MPDIARARLTDAQGNLLSEFTVTDQQEIIVVHNPPAGTATLTLESLRAGTVRFSPLANSNLPPVEPYPGEPSLGEPPAPLPVRPVPGKEDVYYFEPPISPVPGYGSQLAFLQSEGEPVILEFAGHPAYPGSFSFAPVESGESQQIYAPAIGGQLHFIFIPAEAGGN